MVDVVYLAEGEQPAEDRDWVSVEHLPPARSGTESLTVIHGAGATFYVERDNDWEPAIGNAIMWADKHRIQTVYVRSPRPRR